MSLVPGSWCLVLGAWKSISTLPKISRHFEPRNTRNTRKKPNTSKIQYLRKLLTRYLLSKKNQAPRTKHQEPSTKNQAPSTSFSSFFILHSSFFILHSSFSVHIPGVGPVIKSFGITTSPTAFGCHLSVAAFFAPADFLLGIESFKDKFSGSHQMG